MLQQAPWPRPPALPALGSDDVHVFRAPLDAPPAAVGAHFELLDAAERGRAARYVFQKDRDHFVVARATLRTILGRYLRLDPARLAFDYGPYGKPSLADAQNGQCLRFNVSHSRGLALYAVTLGREIGLDLEYMRDDVDLESIADQFFSRREAAALRALPAHERVQGFFNCWTRKEAYIKARGEGLSHPLDQFDVALAPGEPAALLHTAADGREAARWSLRELSPGAGYAAAVAVEGRGLRLSCWQASHLK
ncbi:MAG TPA: 4'-phosphopantetheinyl transferase superfamily protein [Pyrinomonadaceae bacterium]|jgi:4'-phosphopantetheinyl transferase|nr:4'-phosphopantetheinyl transferase superfamily protein [Pyrinomonadaceae bacterium]